MQESIEPARQAGEGVLLMARRLLRWFAFWRESTRRIHARDLIAIPCLIGLLTGGATIGFVELINLVQWLAIGSTGWPLHVIEGLHWYYVLLVPMVGGLIVGLLEHFLAPEVEGHGVPEVIEAVMLRGGRFRRRVAAVKALASAFTIGTGGSVGREGPIVQIGASLASVTATLLRLPVEQTKTLAACGAAAGIAAVFNAPIAGAFFALEVIAGNFAMAAFGPVVLSSVFATVVSRGYFGDYPAFVVQPYEMESVVELAAYVGLGVLCGLVGAMFVWTMDRFESLALRTRIPKIWRPAAGGLVLGVMIVLLPNLYGVGYATMDSALSGKLAWQMLAILVPAKIVATSLTLASGGSGGVFLPSLYIGSVAGGCYGVMVHRLLGGLSADSGAYALVGLAGTLAAATHSPITAMILLIELTGNYKIILPVMIVVTIATIVGRSLKEDSLYTLKLRRSGIALHRREDVIMRTHTVRDVVEKPSAVVRANLPLAQIVRTFLEHEAVRAYVTDEQDRLTGIISIHDIKSVDVEDLEDLVLACDIAQTQFLRVTPEDTLADCMDRFILSEHDELPVIGSAGEFMGVVSRRALLRVYSTELLKHEFLGVAGTDETGRSVRKYIHLTQGLMLLRVPVPTWLAGRSLRDANLRVSYRLTVVAILPGGKGEERLPDPEVALETRDVLVVVGTREDIDRFQAAG